MKALSIIVLQIFLTSNLFFANTSKDYEYVWAINGLNLREAPNTKSKVIKKLTFGDSLKIIERTSIKYTNILIKKTKPEKHSIYLQSNWVKVIANGNEGFVIDGYLLDMPCPNQREQIDDYLSRMSNRFGLSELNEKYPLRFGTINFNTNQIMFPSGKRINFKEKEEKVEEEKTTESENDYGGEEFRYFKGFTSSELLVFLNPFYGLENKKDFELKVRRNWREKIWMTDGGMQEIELKMFKNNIIIFYYKISC